MRTSNVHQAHTVLKDHRARRVVQLATTAFLIQITTLKLKNVFFANKDTTKIKKAKQPVKYANLATFV